ncbi:MAG: hypothetical protein KGJ11_01075, partial [Candidatus Omnitrophica bacterium]|nr:hypothetical protein [Candidatus Omnitrophota bacterium]
AVQNGIRRRWNLKDSLAPVPLPGSIISMPMLVCFGQYDVELFKRCHHQIDYYHPLGALKAGYYKSVLSKRNGVYEFDVCLISEWDEAIASGGFLPAFGKGLTVMNGFLSRYLKEEKRTGCVALRSNNKKEKDYFLSQLGGQMTLVDNNSNELTSYNTVDRSRVSISLVSTLAYEAFGWGARVLFCNFTGDDQYDFPSPGIWSTSEGHYESFKAKLDLLMTVSQEEYRWKTKEAAAYVMNNTTAIPPHEFIRKLVLEQIEAP